MGSILGIIAGFVVGVVVTFLYVVNGLLVLFSNGQTSLFKSLLKKDKM